MQKLSVIVATLFIFTLAGCVKNAKVNLPKASPEAAKMAQVVADYVVKNGVDDPDCKVLQKCRKVIWGGGLGDDGVMFDYEFKVKEKFGKRTLVINVYSLILDVTLKFVDKKADGVIDSAVMVSWEGSRVIEGVSYKHGVFGIPEIIWLISTPLATQFLFCADIRLCPHKQ